MEHTSNIEEPTILSFPLDEDPDEEEGAPAGSGSAWRVRQSGSQASVDRASALSRVGVLDFMLPGGDPADDPMAMYRAGIRIFKMAEWLEDASVLPYSVTPMTRGGSYTVPPFEVVLTEGGTGELEVRIGCSAFLTQALADPMYGSVNIKQSDVNACLELLARGASFACVRIPDARCRPQGFCSAELAPGSGGAGGAGSSLRLMVELRRVLPKEAVVVDRDVFNRRFPPNGSNPALVKQAEEVIHAARTINTAKFSIDLIRD